MQTCVCDQKKFLIRESSSYDLEIRERYRFVSTTKLSFSLTTNKNEVRGAIQLNLVLYRIISELIKARLCHCILMITMSFQFMTARFIANLSIDQLIEVYVIYQEVRGSDIRFYVVQLKKQLILGCFFAFSFKN